MKRIPSLLIVLITLLFLTSCSDDDDPIVVPLGDFENGYFISNEGPFNNGTGSITFVGDDGTIVQNAYKSVNNEDLGNIVQSIALANQNAYIIVNNSNKIVVANRYTLEKITEIKGEDIKNPRYFVAEGTTGYLSNWGDPFDTSDDFIAVIDLNSNTVTETIAVGEGPEEMLLENSKLYVNLQGGYGQNNQVIVINTNSNLVENTIEVGDVPNSIQSDGTGTIWVLCGGKPNWTGDETSGQLYKIASSSNETSSISFGGTEHPDLLVLEDGNLFYNLNGKVFKMDSKTTSLPEQAITGWDGFYYVMKGHNGKIYATDAGDFASEGTLKVFDSSSEVLLETNATGIIPGDIVFQ
jgi:YVTN family beta-propeller protein